MKFKVTCQPIWAKDGDGMRTTEVEGDYVKWVAPNEILIETKEGMNNSYFSRVDSVVPSK